MTSREYHEAEGVSSSQLKTLHRFTPYHLNYELNHKKEDTPALLFGRAAHKYILEKEDFFNEFSVAPECDRRTTEGKKIYNDFLLDSAGKDVISLKDFEVIKEMDAAIDDVPNARELLTGVCEESHFWVDGLTAELCKCRPDCLTEFNGKPYIVDYKTTSEPLTNGSFERISRRLGYKLQAGMYCEGLFNSAYTEYGFAFVAQEKTAPYAARVYICSPEYIQEGQDDFRAALNIYHHCKETGNWYGYEGFYGQYEELYGEGD